MPAPLDDLDRKILSELQQDAEQSLDEIARKVGSSKTPVWNRIRRMRKQGVKCPVLMLTGHDSDSDTILGLDAGANDYVTKPFKFPVLLARIRAQLRQHEQSEDAVFQLGHYTFKPALKMLVDEKERKIRLTEKETNILKYLYRASQGVVARDVLLHEVWGYKSSQADCSVWQIPLLCRGNGTATSLLDLAGLLPGPFFFWTGR